MTSKEEKEERKAMILIDKIAYLTEKLPSTVPTATKDSKIYSVFNSKPGETDHQTFNRRFDAAFAAELVNDDGTLQHLTRGEYGMDLVTKYLEGLIPILPSLPLEIMFMKLERLLNGLLAVV